MILPFSMAAQKLSWVNTTVNFGLVGDWNSPPAGFKFKNTGDKKLMFLPQKHGREVLVRYPNRAIMPGEEGEIIVQYYTGEIGPFAETVEVYTNASNRPEKLSIKGNIKSIYANALTACPSFQNEPIARSTEPNVVQTVDAETNTPVVNAQVEVYDRGIRKAINGTNLDGVAVNWIEPGKYIAIASKTGYEKTEQQIAFSKRERTQIVYMKRSKTQVLLDEESIIVSAEDRWSEAADEVSVDRFKPSAEKLENIELGIRTNEQIEASIQNDPVEVIDLGITINEVLANTNQTKESEAFDLGINANDQWNEEPTAEAVQNTEAEIEALIETALQENSIPESLEPSRIMAMTEPEFSTEKFRPNNVLLLLDVSGSMKEDDKMEKLKASIRRLVLMLREVDVLTMIAYNSDSWELLPPTPVRDNKAIIALVDSLEPYGYTNGVKGMESAYESLRSQLIEGGNNQLIIATDGKFNSSRFSEQEALQLVKDNSDKGIVLSIIGFGDDKEAGRLMKKLANLGEGNFMQVMNNEDPTELLAEEIKTRSRK